METENTQYPPTPNADFLVISLDLIDDPERPMRSDLSPESVADLVLSIKQVGIIEPLVVKRKNDRFEIIAGHRRIVAAGIAGLAQVPCYIVDVTKEQGELLKIHENLYRADVKPSDEAEHFKYLIEHHKLTPTRISKLINKSDSYVLERLAIFNYPPELKYALDNGEIKFSVAREFGKMDDVIKMREFLKYAIVSGITPDVARRWVQEYRTSQDPASSPPETAISADPTSGTIECLSTCIYCQQPLNLKEANVVYIHDRCLSEANHRESPSASL